MPFAAVALCLLLAACGASSPSTTPSDAATRLDTASDGPCPSDYVRLDGVCTSATEANCNGVACARNTFCTLDTDGVTRRLICAPPI